MIIPNILLSFLSSFSLTYVFTFVLIRFLKKNEFYASVVPRSVHKKFVPVMGGIGFVYSFFISTFIFAGTTKLEELIFFLAGVLVVFLLGICDDNLNLNAKIKFFISCIAAIVVVYLGDIRIHTFNGFLGITTLPNWISYGFSMFVLVALSHAYNLSDGIDGLAGSLASIALLVLGCWFVLVDLPTYSLLSFTLLGGVLAFLKFNWSPAQIYMGDTGSLTLGFIIATLLIVFFSTNEVLPSQSLGKIAAPFTMGMALVGYPLFDTFRVMLRRLFFKKNPFHADKGHIHHVLLRTALSHTETTRLISFTQLFFVLLFYQMADFSDQTIIPLFLSVGILIAFGIEWHLAVLVKRKIKEKQQLREKSRRAQSKIA